jgi:hypothetical protein
VVESSVEAEYGAIAAAGAGPEYALVVEAVNEGALLHYGEPRLLDGHDDDLALLAGDYLYAIGIERLAALGDCVSVLRLAELIGATARAHSEGCSEELPALWRDAAQAISDEAGSDQ